MYHPEGKLQLYQGLSACMGDNPFALARFLQFYTTLSTVDLAQIFYRANRTILLIIMFIVTEQVVYHRRKRASIFIGNILWLSNMF